MNQQYFQLLFYFLRLRFPACRVTSGLPLAQAVHESAAWTSPVYRRANNMFGMGVPEKRVSTASNLRSRAQYATYGSPLASILDYLYALDARGITTDAQLLAWLSLPAARGGYAADPNYVRLITRLRDSFGSSLLAPAAVLGPLAVAALFSLAAVVALIKYV